MEYKNETGKSISDIVKEVEGQEIKVVLVGAGVNMHDLSLHALTVAHMRASKDFMLVPIESLPKSDQDNLLSSETKVKLVNDSDDELADKLINGFNKHALDLRANSLKEISIKDINKKPFYQTLPRHKKKKYWKK